MEKLFRYLQKNLWYKFLSSFLSWSKQDQHVFYMTVICTSKHITYMATHPFDHRLVAQLKSQVFRNIWSSILSQ